MSDLGRAIMDAAAGVAAGAILGALWLNIKWLLSSRRTMEKILHEIASIQSNMAILFKMQGPFLMSIKASLEAQRDGKCNGNVDEALTLISEEKRRLRSPTSSMHSPVRGRRKKK